MTLALYRKYRPRTFADVIGQEHVTEPLMQALRTDRLHHAYLFSGPRGCGKTSSARVLARSLNCEKGPTPEPCGECESCRALPPDGPGSIDVVEIDAASHGGVDDARELRERAFFAPASSRFKVYVIDEAHMVSTQGFNALLKVVEEPPDYIKFVFATTEPEKVLGTIKSRTHHYPFRLIPPGVLRPYLEKLCREEGVSVEAAVFPLVVRAGGGSVRDSLSVLDQLIAGSGVYGVTYARAVALLGVTDVALIDEMTDALAAGDGASAFATVDRVAEAGHDPRRFASDLLERLRDLIVLQQVPDAAASGIIDAPADQLERMTAQATRIGQATLSRLADIAHNGLTEMRGTTAPRLLLELIVARMLLPGAEESTGALLQRLERMERRLGVSTGTDSAGAHPPTPAVTSTATSVASSAATAGAEAVRLKPAPESVLKSTAPAGVVTSAPATPATPGVSAEALPPETSGHEHAGTLDAAAVRRVWDEVLSVVRRRSPRAWAVVREASVRDVQGEEIVLVFQHAVHANMLSAQAELLVEAVREVLGGSWQVRAELGGSRQLQAELEDIEIASAAHPRAPGIARAPSAAEVTDPATTTSDRDWPTLVQPGGAATAGDTGEEVIEAAPAPTTRRSSGGDEARTSARGSAAKSSRTPAARTPAKAKSAGARTVATSASAGAASPDEPRVDPETDRAGPDATPAPGYDGFDPGDEPDDDDAAIPAARPRSGEQQAMQLLVDTFGAEKIGESDQH